MVILLAVMVYVGFVMSLLALANSYENGKWFRLPYSQPAAMVGGMLVGIGVVGLLVSASQ